MIETFFLQCSDIDIQDKACESSQPILQVTINLSALQSPIAEAYSLF